MMNALRRVWDHFEEGFIAFLLAAMTLVTFVYVILNNLYTLFYNLADRWEGSSELFFAIGDSILGMAQSMTWSIALTKALFAWLIFFGLAYGVRTAGHIGVDALVKLASKPDPAGDRRDRLPGLPGLCRANCRGQLRLGTHPVLPPASARKTSATTASCSGISPLIVPFGYAMVFIRFLEIFVRILRNQQTGLGLADEAADALKINEHGEHK